MGNYEKYCKFVSGSLDTETETIHISSDKQRIATIDNDLVRYQISNHLGSSALELDENADIISYEEYYPFGSTSYRSGRNETEVSQKRYKYVMKELDNETGLYYYGMRYYASWICRFISVDPLQHKYPYYTPFQYAGNMPITFIDLDGAEPYPNPNAEQDATRVAKDPHPGVSVMRGKGGNNVLPHEPIERRWRTTGTVREDGAIELYLAPQHSIETCSDGFSILGSDGIILASIVTESPVVTKPASEYFDVNRAETQPSLPNVGRELASKGIRQTPDFVETLQKLGIVAVAYNLEIEGALGTGWDWEPHGAILMLNGPQEGNLYFFGNKPMKNATFLLDLSVGFEGTVFGMYSGNDEDITIQELEGVSEEFGISTGFAKIPVGISGGVTWSTTDKGHKLYGVQFGTELDLFDAITSIMPVSMETKVVLESVKHLTSKNVSYNMSEIKIKDNYNYVKLW